MALTRTSADHKRPIAEWDSRLLAIAALHGAHFLDVTVAKVREPVFNGESAGGVDTAKATRPAT